VHFVQQVVDKSLALLGDLCVGDALSATPDQTAANAMPQKQQPEDQVVHNSAAAHLRRVLVKDPENSVHEQGQRAITCLAFKMHGGKPHDVPPKAYTGHALSQVPAHVSGPQPKRRDRMGT
jgi:hypothetical protein